MSEPQRRATDPPAIAALRELKEHQPDLAPAIDLQIEIAALMRRVSARAPLPALASATDRQARLAAGTRVLSYSDFRFEWSDVRLALRETARALEAAGALVDEELAATSSLVRGETPALEKCLARWFDLSTSLKAGETPPRETSAGNDAGVTEGLQEVLDTAMRPFLARAASAALTGLDLSAWNRQHCPACGADADFAVITKDGKRHLSCHRCRTQWPWHAWACPRCGNDDQKSISSFATRDGSYRVYGCGRCHRYLKAYDSRHASRPFLPEVDLIATLPLDAAAQGKGFEN